MKKAAIILLLFATGAGVAQADIPASQRQVLIDLYNSTNGAGWSQRTNWRNTGDTDFNSVGSECSWYGVTCNGTGDSVTGLDLSSNSLSGPIPASIKDLPDLEILCFQSNQLSGSIPPEIGDLSNIQRLDLSENQLTGPIPVSLATPFLLQYLYLDDNQLNGSIPVELGNMNLKFLYLENNQLSGNIPAELGGIYYLQNLNLHDNRLSGNIPAELGDLPLLKMLFLYSNQLSGAIPAALGNLSTLDDDFGLDLRWNALHSDDAALIAFLNTKQATGDWESTQTIAPEDILASNPTSSSVTLDWTAITYQGDSGAYAVFVDPHPPAEAVFSDGFESDDTKWWGLGNPWRMTPNKLYTSIVVDGLDPGTAYDFVLRTITDAHWLNDNEVVSEASEAVAETTDSR